MPLLYKNIKYLPQRQKLDCRKSSQAETVRFLKEHLPLKQIIKTVRGRFGEINELLKEVGINKHDLGHQLRTMINAAQAGRQLDLSHQEVLQASLGAIIHDIGYNRPDEDMKDSEDGYNIGSKAKFKKHALYGAKEAKAKLTAMVADVQKNGDKSPYAELVSYKMENGDTKLIDEEDIERIAEAILNHNDYGKADKGYDPRKISKGALLVQLFDKLDICRNRVYKEHMTPESFIKGNEEFDPQNCHKVVPYSIKNYEWKIDEEESRMEITYHVDLSDFRAMMKAHDPTFEYSEDDFRRDFEKAYTKNCRIAAEAIGVILDFPTSQQALTVNLEFGKTEESKIPYSRPERAIYEREAEALRWKLGEVLEKQLQAA